MIVSSVMTDLGDEGALEVIGGVRFKIIDVSNGNRRNNRVLVLTAASRCASYALNSLPQPMHMARKPTTPAMSVTSNAIASIIVSTTRTATDDLAGDAKSLDF